MGSIKDKNKLYKLSQERHISATISGAKTFIDKLETQKVELEDTIRTQKFELSDINANIKRKLVEISSGSKNLHKKAKLEVCMPYVLKESKVSLHNSDILQLSSAVSRDRIAITARAVQSKTVYHIEVQMKTTHTEIP